MRYLVIGLGIYGSNLAIDLTAMGHEVIGADKNPSLVEAIKDYISTAYIIDSTDEISLNALPLKNVDTVIVAIGENFGASIRTVALLKKLEVKRIYARAIDKLHQSILEAMEIERILTPEQRAARDLVNEIGVGGAIRSLEITEDSYVLRFTAPESIVGMRFDQIFDRSDDDDLSHLQLISVARAKESTGLIGVRRKHYVTLSPSALADGTFLAGDIIVIIGSPRGFRKFFDQLNDLT